MQQNETTKEELEASINAALERIGLEVDHNSTRIYTPEEVYALLLDIKHCG